MSDPAGASGKRSAYDAVMEASFQRFQHLRRLGQLFPRFAGAAMRTLEDRGYAVVEIATTGPQIHVALEDSSETELGLTLTPFREDIVFLTSLGPWAELTVELGRTVDDPQVLRMATSASTRSMVGSFLGASQMAARGTASGGARLHEPGAVSLRVAGRRVHVGVNLILGLGEYGGGGKPLDLGRIGEDLDAIVHALGRCHTKIGATGTPAVS